MKARVFVSLRVVILFAVISTGWSQTLTSDLLGTVKDSSGSVVAHASLVATNTETNISSNTQTDESGNYIFTQLRPGPYVLVVENPGFQKLTLSNIVLAIDQRARQDVTLQVGQLAEQITVAATAIMLESEKATLGQVIGEKRIQEMPLNGRNF